MAYLISIINKLTIWFVLLNHKSYSANLIPLKYIPEMYRFVSEYNRPFQMHTKPVSPSAVRIVCNSGCPERDNSVPNGTNGTNQILGCTNEETKNLYTIRLVGSFEKKIPTGCGKRNTSQQCMHKLIINDIYHPPRTNIRTFPTIPLIRPNAQLESSKALSIMVCRSEGRNTSECELIFPRLFSDHIYFFEIQHMYSVNVIQNKELMNSTPTDDKVYQTFVGWNAEAAAITFPEPGILNLNQTRPTSVLLMFFADRTCNPSRCGTIVQLMFRYSQCRKCMHLDITYDAMMTKNPSSLEAVKQVIIATNKQMQYNSTLHPFKDGVIDCLITDLSPNSTYYYHFLILYNTNIMYLQEQSMFTTPAGLPSSPDRPHIAINADANLKIEWTAPFYVGGDPIRSYDLQYNVESPTGLDGANKKWHKIIVNQTEDGINNNSFVFKLDKKCNNCRISAKVAARNSVGIGNFSKMASINTGGVSHSLNNTTISFIAFSVGIALLLMGILTFYCYRNNMKAVEKNSKFPLPPIVLPKDLASLPQISSEQTKICEKLGEGNFGTVYAGIAFGLSPSIRKARTVAIKMLKDDATLDQQNEIIKEALTMRNLHHPNILGLLGLCSEDQKFWLVLEFMDSGDLAQYLKQLRPQGSIPSQVNLTDLIRMVKQVANGAAYLEEMEYTHRDLAARNILVSGRDPEQCHLKIADFGLTRGLYKKQYYRMNEQSLVPVSWTAPEVFKNQFFDSKSDTWAFGIVVWEIISLGETPYVQLTPDQVGPFVQNGGTEVPPANCGHQLSQIMHQCWEMDSIMRKSLSEISSQITEMFDAINESQTSNELFWSKPFDPILLPLPMTTTSKDTDSTKALIKPNQANSQESNVSNRMPHHQNNEAAADLTEAIPLLPINPETSFVQNTIKLNSKIDLAESVPFVYRHIASSSLLQPQPDNLFPALTAPYPDSLGNTELDPVPLGYTDPSYICQLPSLVIETSD